MVNLNCLRFYGRVEYQTLYLGGQDHAYFPNESGELLAAALGPAAHVLLCANHGTVVVGATLAQALEDLFYFERAAMNQLLAAGTGQPLSEVEPAVCQHFQQIAQEPAGKAEYADIFLEAWMQQLDATEPEYADLDPASMVAKQRRPPLPHRPYRPEE
eukprot:SAG22_NODE_4348_length_1295_cov_0.830268_1_plen_157_part_10